MDETLGFVVAVLAGLVVLAVLLVLVARQRMAQQVELQRHRSSELRERAEADRIEVARREAEAAKVRARARLTQAEADELEGRPRHADPADSDQGNVTPQP